MVKVRVSTASLASDTSCGSSLLSRRNWPPLNILLPASHHHWRWGAWGCVLQMAKEEFPPQVDTADRGPERIQCWRRILYSMCSFCHFSSTQYLNLCFHHCLSPFLILSLLIFTSMAFSLSEYIDLYFHLFLSCFFLVFLWLDFTILFPLPWHDIWFLPSQIHAPVHRPPSSHSVHLIWIRTSLAVLARCLSPSWEHCWVKKKTEHT